MENLVANAIKSLNKNARQNFAKMVRTDPNIWNGVHGNGDAAIDFPNGKIIGIVKRESELLSNATVIAQKGADIFETITNNEGIYSIELVSIILNMDVFEFFG